MRKLISLLLVVMLLISCGKGHMDQKSNSTKDNVQVGHLKDTLTYYVGLIKSVPDKPELSKEEVNHIQQEHLNNIIRLAEQGSMALAGPFFIEDNSNTIRGLFFYKVKTKHEADTLAATDPAVKAGRLRVENFPWIGSANMTYDNIKGSEGMKSYFATIFWRENTDKTPPTFENLYNQLSNDLKEIVDTGKIVLAGPFESCHRTGQPFAMFIYTADSMKTIEKIARNAPGMLDSALTSLTMNWYGPVGLRE